MLYRILIVDDEDIIRKGLSSTIDWKEMGFVVSGTAASGAQALSMIDVIKPHVVLADIRMPGISGIELAGNIAENYPDIYVVILTGFGEFDYAKEAIDYNVYSYLLKPYNGEKLRSVFKKLKSDIDRKTEAEDILGIANRALLNKEFRSCMEEEIPLDKTKLLSSWIRSHKWINLYMFLETSGNAVSRMLDYLDGKALYFKNGENNVSFLTNVSPEELDNELGDLPEYFGLYTLLHDGDEKLIDSIREIKNKSKIVFFNECGVYSIDRIRKEFIQKTENSLFTEEEIRELAFEFSLRNNGKIESIFESILSKKRERVVYHRAGIRPVLISNLEKLFSEIKEISFFTKENYESIDKCRSVNCIYMLVSRILRENSPDIERKAVKTDNSIVRRVLKIIKLRYMEDITLDIIAAELKVSPPHLSRLFKKEAGVNFKDYLKEYRIHLAKKKLKNTTMKIYEIAESVGYRDQAYFSDIFKKVVGYSPNKYKNMNTDSE